MIKVEFIFGTGFDKNGNAIPVATVTTALQNFLAQGFSYFGLCSVTTGQLARPAPVTGQLLIEPYASFTFYVTVGPALLNVQTVIDYIKTTLNIDAVLFLSSSFDGGIL